MSAHPKMHRRWAEIFIQKWDNESHTAAAEWARRVVPPEESPSVKEEMRKIRQEQAKPKT